MLFQFADRIYLQIKTQWFVWEPSWESYRPIDNVSWNGTKFEIDDKAYCSDPTSELYGYGNEKMLELCQLLSEKYAVKDAKKIHTLATSSAVWFRDRMVSLTPCAPKDKESWKRMLCGTRAKTCRNIVRNRFTKRNLIK
jgi:hypothetical protein